MMTSFGLIGFPLGHSFSKRYFEEKFQQEDISASFLNFEIENLNDFPIILQENPQLKGLNVTIPHKERILPFLDEIEEAAKVIGAINTIKIIRKKGQIYTIGYNTDYNGFGKSLNEFLPHKNLNALILGTGGASKAIAYALQKEKIPYKFVSRTPKQGQYGYSQLNQEVIEHHHLIINTTPLGTFPNVDTFPNIPYPLLTPKHFLFDLVYNPAQTTFMQKGKWQGSKVCNGYAMLCYQATYSWKIWNS